MQGDEKMWSTKELAATAKVDSSRIRQLLIAGKIKGQKVGRDWVISDLEARRYLESRPNRTLSA